MILLSRKNKKEIVINKEELKPTVLYTIKERKVNILAILLLFGLFIGVIYYLPQLNEMYQAYKKGQTTTPVKKPTLPSTGDEQKEEDKYRYSRDLAITTEEFTLSNFSLANNVFRFTITNEKSVEADLKNLNYFLEIYSASDKLLKRIKIGEDILKGNETREYSYAFTDSSISYFELRPIKEDDYEEITLSKDANNKSILTCTMKNDKIIYNFTNDELTTIAETNTMTNTETNYQSELTKYQNQVNVWTNLPGITNNLNATASNFTYSIIIDVNSASMDDLNNLNYYKAKTAPKVINFEMNARGYTCQ